MLNHSRYLIFIFLLCFGSCSQAQLTGNEKQSNSSGIFKIIKINGNIINSKTKKALTRGAEINSQTVLKFSTPEDYLILIDQEKKLQTARKATSPLGYKIEPLNSRKAKRGGKILNDIAFKSYLKGRKLLILGGEMGIEVGQEVFPMDSTHFFYVQYDLLPDSIAIPKKLPFQKQRLFINQDSLFNVEGDSVSIDSTYNFALYYYNLEKTESTFINDFSPIFPSAEELNLEVGLLLEFLGKFTPRVIKIDVIEDFLFESYGVPEKENLEKWLKDQFGV